MPLLRSSRRSFGRVSRYLPRGGFTLLEMLSAMAVVAILVGLSIGALRSSSQRAALAKARGELAALTQALEAYKQHYGDYPQTGNSPQAPAVPGAVVTMAQAQAQVFNALTGVYGPANFSTRLNGPVFVELAKMSLEVSLEDVRMRTVVAVPKGTPPLKEPVANAFLDPWGRRYMYYYKPAPMPGRPPNNQWRLPGYVLYSVGPDGQHTPPNIATGLFTGTTQTTGLNADNVYATP